MKIWCAAGVNLTGGRTKDGGDIVGASVFYSAPPPEEHKAEEEDEISRLDAELKEGASLGQEAAEADQQLSSLVWICTSTHSISKVTVIDANNPADVLESFHVCSSHLLCIASVPGETSHPLHRFQNFVQNFVKCLSSSCSVLPWRRGRSKGGRLRC